MVYTPAMWVSFTLPDGDFPYLYIASTGKAEIFGFKNLYSVKKVQAVLFQGKTALVLVPLEHLLRPFQFLRRETLAFSYMNETPSRALTVLHSCIRAM